jgi:nucleoside-diphosphate-sugar epimerase
MKKNKKIYSIFILGGSGFLGGAFCDFFKKNNIRFEAITKNNYKNFVGKKCDIFINANGNSKKYLYAKDQLLDFELNVFSVYKTFKDFKFSKYVYLSTSDVYGSNVNLSKTDEKVDINLKSLSGYAFHKYISENLVKYFCRKWFIFRLNGFVGKNLKKNIIFDLLNYVPLFIKPNSRIQFMETIKMAECVFAIVNKNQNMNKIYNLSGSGHADILKIIKRYKLKYKIRKNAKKIVHLIKLEKIKKIIDLPDSQSQCVKFIEESLNINKR